MENFIDAIFSSGPSLIGEISFGNEKILLYRSGYITNKALAIFAETAAGEPFATISEYHNGIERALAPNEFVIQTRNLNKKFIKILLDSDMFEDTKRAITFGPFETKEPIWRLRSLI